VGCDYSCIAGILVPAGSGEAEGPPRLTVAETLGDGMRVAQCARVLLRDQPATQGHTEATADVLFGPPHLL